MFDINYVNAVKVEATEDLKLFQSTQFMFDINYVNAVKVEGTKALKIYTFYD
jgi:hypothetical protein